jgi:WD40-like Beta Propeller Repeat
VDDRDKDLTHLFVRDLDEIPLPARGEWRRVRGRETIVRRSSRYLLAAGAVVAVLAVALIIGLQLSQRQQNAAIPSSSPTPSATASASPVTLPGFGPSPLPSATPTSSAADGYNDDFGFVVTAPTGPVTTIRTESGGTRRDVFDLLHPAVSPDGRQIAWFSAPGGGVPQELRIGAASDPSKYQLIHTIGVAERGGTIVWANDSSGLLYQTYSLEPAPSPPSPPGNPSLYVIHRFDMRGTTTPDVVVLTSPTRGLVLEPIAWDRASNVAAVVETGEGGFMISYDVIRFNGTEAVTTKTAVVPNGQMLAYSVVATSDAKLVLDATFANGGSLMWWPLADFGARQTITGARSGLWRPQTHEVATIGPCTGDPACLRLLNVDTGASRTAYGFAEPNMGLRTFRPDGSAAIVFAPQAPGANTYDYTILPLPGGQPVTFKEANGLIASVRLR